MKPFLFLIVTSLLLTSSGVVTAKPDFVPQKSCRLTAEDFLLNPMTSELISDDHSETKKAASLKAEVESHIADKEAEADVSYEIQAPEAGLYVMTSYASLDDATAAAAQKAKGKHDSIEMKIQVGDQRPTKRVVFVPWDLGVSRQVLGKFQFNGKKQLLKFWLPKGVRLGMIELITYREPKVPEAAQNYQPTILPPSTHPRIWLNSDSLPLVKHRLALGENKIVWEQLEKTALTPIKFQFTPDEEISYDSKLETAIQAKAFYSLMTGDNETGKDAIELTKDYISHVEFGNLLDITREIGRAIYTASLVYDWCNALMTPEDRQVIRGNLMRLAIDMECGWPPFKQVIVNGHGGESQINRDLLSMSIALYDDDPVPYRYTSYRILEELVPMRAFEYQTPRHNQGIDYGAVRFGWEMHAAWLFYRMTGKRVFNDNLKTVRQFWPYMRTPDGLMLRDGDRFDTADYWRSPVTTLLNYAYADDPVIKGEFERQGGIKNILFRNPQVFLCVNDPDLKAESSMDSWPLTLNTGPILGSLIIRTGWNLSPDSSDVIAEIKGGGYHSGNHQHADAGAIQLYYRGYQFGDLGEYKFYGTPYDTNFNKRSIAHSMMRVLDPGEVFSRAESNDGGTRYVSSTPRNPDELQSTPMFNNGRVISADFGPSEKTPTFNYFDLDLTGAYSEKVKDYHRRFCLINLHRDDVPAAIILLDDITSSSADFQKSWQINPFNPPKVTGDRIILQSQHEGQIGRTFVNMLLPVVTDREITVMSGKEASSVSGHYYLPPKPELPEASGHRVVVTPKKKSPHDHFLTILQTVADGHQELPIEHKESAELHMILIDGHFISLPKGIALQSRGFRFALPPSDRSYQVALAGMEAGTWKISGPKGETRAVEVISGQNTIYFEAAAGEYQLSR